MQTKTIKNRGLMGLVALAMLAMLVGLGWTVFQQNTVDQTPTAAETTPAPAADAIGTTDTTPLVTDESTVIPESYTVAEGDTLSSIAAKFYDDPDYYWAIERANDLVGTRDHLEAGMTLKLPSMADVASTN